MTSKVDSCASLVAVHHLQSSKQYCTNVKDTHHPSNRNRLYLNYLHMPQCPHHPSAQPNTFHETQMPSSLPLPLLLLHLLQLLLHNIHSIHLHNTPRQQNAHIMCEKLSPHTIRRLHRVQQRRTASRCVGHELSKSVFGPSQRAEVADWFG